MLQTGTRGGQELRGMNCSQFQPKYQEQIGYYYIFQPMLQGSFKNYAGGIKDCKKVRKPIHIFNEPTVMDCFNPYKVIDTYFSLLPPGWTGEGTMNPLFWRQRRTSSTELGLQRHHEEGISQANTFSMPWRGLALKASLQILRSGALL